jgi:hypothetical protein
VVPVASLFLCPSFQLNGIFWLLSSLPFFAVAHSENRVHFSVSKLTLTQHTCATH